MRILVVLILLAFGYQRQQSTVNGQQILCTVPEPVEGTTLGASTSSATEEKTQRLNDAKTQSKDSATLCLCDSASYYESQIRKADSLYKNYLPQYNFDEVKAAMEFFDSLRLSKTTDNSQQTTDFVHRIFPNKRQRTMGTVPEPVDGTTLGASTSSATAYSRTVDCCPLSVDFICAKAHYYHAVGLTEKDDIVGACEHYLIALEIMEEDDVIKRLRDTKTHRRKAKINCNLNKDDYEKVRFIYLIHTRLGELYYDANFCDISLLNYKKALCYSIISRNDISIARTIKCIGHIFQLSNVADSALYYYNKSQNSSIDDINKLDVEKCIAQILFNKGEKDSAYMLLKKNLHLINDNVKYSYHCTLGNMFYIDKEYDSALYYLEKSLDENIITQKIAFTTKLSSIYDSLGNYEKKAYYDNISLKLLINSTNIEIDKSKLQTLYDEYNKRKAENIKATTKKRTIILSSTIAIIIFSIIIAIIYNHKKHRYKLSEEIKAKDKHIKHNEFKNALIEGKIKSKNIELQQKDKQIKSQQLKIAELQSKLENRKDNLKEYYQSEICVKILNEINELSKANKMTSDLKPLSQEEFVMLFQSANLHLGEFIKNLSDKYPSFKKDDVYYLCLVAINLNDRQIAALFNVTYNAVRSRRKKICSYLDIDINENIYKKLQI